MTYTLWSGNAMEKRIILPTRSHRYLHSYQSQNLTTFTLRQPTHHTNSTAFTPRQPTNHTMTEAAFNAAQ
jgi:hypothetical protein